MKGKIKSGKGQWGAEERDGNFKWDGLRNPPYEAGI